MNKHTHMSKKTTYQTVNDNTIISLLLCSKSSALLRRKYRINIHCLTVFLACYVYYKYVQPTFALTSIVNLCTYYNNIRVRKYINILIELGMITQAGPKINHYSLTLAGLDLIADISNNADNVLYSFCNKYNIEL
jgi:predicted transcriptional regulator